MTPLEQSTLISMNGAVDRLRIVFYPHPVLRECCRVVEHFDEELSTLAERMMFLMKEAKGIGLAAPQVGVPIRMFVCRTTEEPSDEAVWVNPVLSDLRGAAEAQEGCLSIPGVEVPKRRASRIVIEGFDLSGRPVRAEGADLLARVWQHEVDHLDGRLIIDGMSEVAELANRRALQQLEADYAASFQD